MEGRGIGYMRAGRRVVTRALRGLRRRLSADRPRVRTARLPGLTPDWLGRLRADPAAIRSGFAAFRADLQAALCPAFAHLARREQEYAFCTVVAHALGPWAADSTCVTYPELLRARGFNCGNYGLLVHHLAREFSAETPDAHRLRVVGWDGPGMGNHQMLFLDRVGGRRSLLLDPTVGLIGDTDFDTVAAGRRVPARRLVLFPVRTGLEAFEGLVLTALVRGRARPSDLLYYFDGFDHLLGRYGHPRDWPTPGACTWRDRAAKEGS